MKYKVYLFFIGMFLNFLLFSYVNFSKKILLDPEHKTFIRVSRSFFVKDNNIYVIDAEGSNIKIYSIDGRFKRVFGRHGAGPDEFLRPILGEINNEELAVLDLNMRHFLIFDIDKNFSFKYKKKILAKASADDFKIIKKGMLLVSGFVKSPDNIGYHFYLMNYNIKGDKDKKEYLLPSYITYGCKSVKEYRARYNNKFKYTGRHVFCDYDAEHYYFIMESNLKVMKMDRKTKKIFSFGKVTNNYIKPFVSKRLKKAYGKDIKVFWDEIEKFSHIKRLFVTNKGIVGVIYSNWKDNNINIYLQLYSKKGKLLSDELLLKAKSDNYYDIITYYNKVENKIYILDNEQLVDDEDDIVHIVYAYKIRI